MDPSQSLNQRPAYNSSENTGMPTAPPPPAYQQNPAGYPPSFPSQPVPQGPYTQGPHPGQTVVTVQPAVYVMAAPHASPEPDYMCYSIFTMLCCCFPLGLVALIYSCSVSLEELTFLRQIAVTSYSAPLNDALGLLKHRFTPHHRNITPSLSWVVPSGGDPLLRCPPLGQKRILPVIEKSPHAHW
ncbi:hypothetical protein QQF64_031179 [Cirrhinus molitorella]|uniref:Uncharacterized protein n=1 Tax=Cirrhinus molitorella TaxID=172907 RepID=A0ABR3N5D5_9TELE